jgi:hypothetical protein
VARSRGRAATLTLAELVAEYLEVHQAEPVTMARPNWLLGKATAALREVRLAALSLEQACERRLIRLDLRRWASRRGSVPRPSSNLANGAHGGV